MKKSALLFFGACFFTLSDAGAMMEPEEGQIVWTAQLTAQRPFLDFVNLAGQAPAVIASALGVNIAPLVGRYSPEGYDFALTNLIVKLPRCQLAEFPQTMREKLIEYSEDEVDLFFMVLDDNYLMNGDSSRNLVFHAIAFPNARATDNLPCECFIGLFEGQGICSSSTGSLPLDTWKPESIVIHPVGASSAFSHNNTRFAIHREDAISSFYTAAHLPGHRATAAYVVLLHDPNSLEACIFNEAQNKASLQEFVSFLVDRKLREDVSAKIIPPLTYHGFGS